MPIPNLASPPRPAPSTQAASPPSPRRASLHDPHLAFLHAIALSLATDPSMPPAARYAHALETAGLPAALTPTQLSHACQDVLRKIDRAADGKTVFEELGMGKVAWALAVQQMALAERPEKDGSMLPDWKWRAVALKLWGLALGMFAADKGEAQGATIHIHTEAPEPAEAEQPMRLVMPRRTQHSHGQDAIAMVPTYAQDEAPPESEEDRVRREAMEASARRFIDRTPIAKP